MGSLPGLDLDFPTTKPSANWRVPWDAERQADEATLETLGVRLASWAFLFAGLLFYFLVAKNFDDMSGLTQTVEALAVIVFSQLALQFLYWRLSNRIDLGTGLRRLSAKVPQEGAVPVQLEVSQESVVTGYDEGFFWLEDGTLFFKGLQTVFRLNREDVPPLAEWPRGRRPNLDAGRVPRWIPVRAEHRPMALSFKLIDPFEDHAARRKTANFDRALTRWLAQRPEGSLESRLPPAELHPSLQGGRFLRYESQVGAFLLTLANLALVVSARDVLARSLASTRDELVLAVGGLLLVGAVKMSLRLWHEGQVRTRLALESLRHLPAR